MSTDELTKMLQDMVPAGPPRLRPQAPQRPRRADARGRGQLAEAARLDRGHRDAAGRDRAAHPKMTLIANALGTPPPDMIEHIHAEGRKVAALCGSPYQARKHADADVDIIIAQGGEGGGHCGEVGSIVLWPQVVKEVAPRPGARGRRHRQRRADRRGPRARMPGRVVGFAVVDGRGVREHAGAAGHLHRRPPRATPCAAGRSPASRAACCKQRLDRGVGGPGQPRAARHAAAVHGVGHGRRRRPTAIPTSPSTSRSTRSARSSASSRRSRRPPRSSSAGSRSTSRRSSTSTS